MKTELIVLLSASVGVVVSALSNIVITYITKKTENDRIIYQQLFDLSLAGWKERIALAKSTQGVINITPLINDIMVNSRILKIIKKKTIKEEDIDRIIQLTGMLTKKTTDYTNREKVKPIDEIIHTSGKQN